MGACCGGMKTSNQHKSLPEKNKAAATAANEQQLNNDGVAAKTTVSGDNHENQQVSNNEDGQLEVAAKETSLEAGPPSALQHNGSPPEAIHSNHVDAEQTQQQAESLKVEEPDLVVAAKASSVSAEAPVPSVSVEEPELVVAASVAEQVSCEPLSSGDDVGNDESVGIDTIQLRISEDGDLEKSSGDIKADTGVTLHEEKQVVVEHEVVSVVTVTNTEAHAGVTLDEEKHEEKHVVVEHEVVSAVTVTNTEAAAPVAEDVTTDAPPAVENEQQPTVTDAAPVDVETKPTADEDVEIAVPYQPEVIQQPDAVIENIPAQETLPEPAATVSAVEAETTVVTTVTNTEEVFSTQETTTVTNVEEVVSTAVTSAVEPEEAHDVPVADVINDSVVAEPSSTVLEVTETSESHASSVIPTESSTVLTSDVVTDDRLEEQQLSAETNEPKLAEEVHPEEAVVVPVVAVEDESLPVAKEEPAAVVETVAVPEEEQLPASSDLPADETTALVSAVVESEHVNTEQPSIEQPNSTELSHEVTQQSIEVPRTDDETVIPVAADVIDKASDESELIAQPVTVVEEFSVTEGDVPPASVDEQVADVQPQTVSESSAVVVEAQPEVSESQEATPVVAETPDTSSDLPSPPYDAEVAPVPVDIQQEPTAIIADEDDLLPPPPPPEDLAVEQPAPPVVVDQEPPSSIVNVDDQQASSLADSGVSQTASSPEELVSSPSGDESSTAANASADETGDVTSSSSVQPSQDVPVSSEA